MSKKHETDPLPLSGAYDILGVPRGANADQINKSYHELARQNHPDVNPDPGAKERMQAINMARDAALLSLTAKVSPAYVGREQDPAKYTYSAAYRPYEARAARNSGIRQRIGAVAAAVNSAYFGLVVTPQIIQGNMLSEAGQLARTPLAALFGTMALGFALLATIQEIHARDSFKKAGGGNPTTPGNEAPQTEGPRQQPPQPFSEPQPYDYYTSTVDAGAEQPPLGWYPPPATPEDFKV